MQQEAKDETLGKVRAEQREIDEAVDALIPKYLQKLEWALEAEFGCAIMRSVEVAPFANVLRNLAHAASDKTMAITGNKRLGEAKADVSRIFRTIIDTSLNKDEAG